MKIYNNVSKTQLSLAAHYGGATINGEKYTYVPGDDTLVRYSDMKQYLKM